MSASISREQKKEYCFSFAVPIKIGRLLLLPLKGHALVRVPAPPPVALALAAVKLAVAERAAVAVEVEERDTDRGEGAGSGTGIGTGEGSAGRVGEIHAEFCSNVVEVADCS